MLYIRLWSTRGSGWVPVGPADFKSVRLRFCDRGGGFDSLPLPPAAKTEDSLGSARGVEKLLPQGILREHHLAGILMAASSPLHLDPLSLI